MSELDHGSASAAQLTSARILARSTIWNVVGHGLPLVVALIAIPVLISKLGTDRFGILALVWVAIGYFGMFDLGLGRALTQFAAQRLGDGNLKDLPRIVWTALTLMISLGVVLGAALASVVPWLARAVLAVPPNLIEETTKSFLLVCLVLPALMMATGFRGLLEAHQRFGLINAVRIPLSVVSYAGPVLAVSISPNLISAVVVVCAVRILDAAAQILLCLWTMPALRKGISVRFEALQPLLRFGGWITVSNIIGPLMVSFDRFLIGGLMSVTAVAYYSAPYDAVTKLWIIPGALTGVLFPAFATAAGGGGERTKLLFKTGVKYTLIALFLPAFLIVLFAEEALTLWLGADFGENSTRVLQILAVGVLVNSLAQVAFALVQGHGRADLTAKLHLCETPFYLAGAWWAISVYGLEGAAAAWTIRASVDAIVLFYFSTRLSKMPQMTVARGTMMIATGVCSILIAAAVPDLGLKMIYAVIVLPLFAISAWTRLMLSEERLLLYNLSGPARQIFTRVLGRSTRLG